MFRNYQEKMEQLKELSETLIDSGSYESNFLGTLDVAMKYIQGAWESFPESYKREIEGEYVSNVIEMMSTAINEYIQDIAYRPDAFEKFNDVCGIVGKNISLYSSRANSRQSVPNTAQDFSQQNDSQQQENTQEYFFSNSDSPENRTSSYSLCPENEQPSERQPLFLDRSDAEIEDMFPDSIPQEEPSDEETQDIPEESSASHEEPPTPEPTHSKPKPKPKQKRKVPPVNRTKTQNDDEPEPRIFQTLEQYFSDSSEKSVSEIEKRFTELKKCVILVNFYDSEENTISCYGLQKGLSLGKTKVTPDEDTKEKTGFFRKKVYGKYLFTYHYYVRFNGRNFKRMPSLNGKDNESDSEEIPISHLVYDSKGDEGSFIQLSMIPQKEGFKVRCDVQTEKTEGTDFLSELLNHWGKSESVVIHSGNDENENIIRYDQSGGIYLKYELEPKQENRDSPKVKTEIVIYLEF